ncbi:hypothetical protein D6D28_09951 [Aureobasidium pullulans]|uniref:Uncharacterized protein n=1 Tax=Aureobasidium pullulans TaxID=5580 RepID=A0A4S8S0I7_AURPU|nr:hypothetical protein D6D28_09951 [Aureobasidium pullulans]
MDNFSNTILTFLRNAWNRIIHFPSRALHLLVECFHHVGQSITSFLFYVLHGIAILFFAMIKLVLIIFGAILLLNILYITIALLTNSIKQSQARKAAKQQQEQLLRDSEEGCLLAQQRAREQEELRRHMLAEQASRQDIRQQQQQEQIHRDEHRTTINPDQQHRRKHLLLLHHQTQLELTRNFNLWRDRCNRLSQNLASVTAIPPPPSQDLAQSYKNANLALHELKEERRLWHPDKWCGVDERYRAQVTKMATQFFQIVQSMCEKLEQ